MLQEQCRIGMQVYFGRSNGVKTLGQVVKLNPTKAKVQTLEARGTGRGSRVGEEWGVPYSMLTQAAGTATTAEAPAPQVEKLEYNPFAGEDNPILAAIVILHSNLSPENLTCDGELSRTEVSRRRAMYTRKLRCLQSALGREVDETEAYHWLESKRKYEQARMKDIPRGTARFVDAEHQS